MLNPSGSGRLTGAVSLSLSSFTTAVLLNTGKVVTCGRNNVGQFGNGGIVNSNIPVYMLNPSGTGHLTGVVAIANGGNTIAVLLNTGEVLTCGYNNVGQLGNGTTTNSSLPVYMLNTSGTGRLTGAVYISCSGTGTAVVLSNGNLVCCGGNGSGQLGIGTYTTSSTLPVYVLNSAGTAPITNVSKVSVDTSYMMILLKVPFWSKRNQSCIVINLSN
jgi:alpha-tubulin suppressor-like RCC1 family protein